MKKRREIEKRYSLRSSLIMLLLTVLGLLCMVFSGDVKSEFWKTFLLGIGSTIFSVGLISFLYDLIQRKQFMEMAAESFSNIMDEKLPERYNNLKAAGITDSFMSLNINAFRERISNVEDTEIRILKIWIPNLHNLYQEFKNAIDQRNCIIKIILLSPDAIQTIEKRAKVLPLKDAEYTKLQIQQNIKFLATLYNEIKNKEKLQVKIHDSFVSLSLIGYGSGFWVGFYLRNRIATDGMIIKINGTSHSHYRELDQHFKAEWDDAEFVDLDNIIT